MKEKHLVVTKYRWNSRTKKNAEIKRIKALAGIDCEIVMEYRDFGKPEIKEGRITHEWFEKNISLPAKAKGFTHAKLVFSMRDGRRWGINSGLRGSNLRDKDFFGEAWIKANETTTKKFDDGVRTDEYVRIFLHEDGHEYKNQGFTSLLIHDFDYKTLRHDIVGFYKTLKFNQDQQDIVLHRRSIDLLQWALSLFGKNTLTNRERLYNKAVSFIGTDASPNDVAPDELGCAETINSIHRSVFGRQIGGGTSTYLLYRALKDNKTFTKVDFPLPGDIVISPSGYGNGQLPNGHVGIVGENGSIMSNDSRTGTWENNYSLNSWREHYQIKGGYPVDYFRKV